MVIKVFIGHEPNLWLAGEVLRHSITSRTSAEVEFHDLKNTSFPINFIQGEGHPLTRFAIPSLCDFKGKALYLDPTSIVLDDIQKLWDMPMLLHGAIARPRLGGQAGFYTNVMSLDCEKLPTWRPEAWSKLIGNEVTIYQKTLLGQPGGLASLDFSALPQEWNEIGTHKHDTKIISFLDPSKQPWKFPNQPFAKLFMEEVKKGIAADEIPEDAIEREVRFGHLYPQFMDDLNALS